MNNKKFKLHLENIQILILKKTINKFIKDKIHTKFKINNKNNKLLKRYKIKKFQKIWVDLRIRK